MSSSVSPVPMNMTGIPNSDVIGNTTPPFDVPSNLDRKIQDV